MCLKPPCIDIHFQLNLDLETTSSLLFNPLPQKFPTSNPFIFQRVQLITSEHLHCPGSCLARINFSLEVSQQSMSEKSKVILSLPRSLRHPVMNWFANPVELQVDLCVHHLLTGFVVDPTSCLQQGTSSIQQMNQQIKLP